MSGWLQKLMQGGLLLLLLAAICLGGYSSLLSHQLASARQQAAELQKSLAQQAGLNGLLQAVRDAVASPHVELAVHLFADLALATSFLGVALGLFDFLADLFKRQDNVRGRLQTGAITFLPPLAFALFYPRGFVLALGFAAIALSVLALLLPSLLVWKTRKKHQAQYRVWGGTPALALVFVCGVTVIAIQLGIASGMLPAVG